jgi:bacillithiol biosynthesis cysteine-adding enzyme BshC
MKKVTYDEVNMLSKLTRAYLRDAKNVEEFFEYVSTEKNIRSVIENRKKRKPVNRAVLVSSLEKQYADYNSKAVHTNILSLANSNTYTITTGHQLNLFTGPLYFIYKIVSAIKTAQQLNQTYPELHFVPVYWMATEDHDFEEINHAYFNGEKIEWNSDQKGMVGEFSLDTISKTVDLFCKSLGGSIHALEISEIIKKAYLQNANLAEATRSVVHALFEKHGLVILDANDSNLKREFVPVVKRELLEQISFSSVTDTISQFDSSFKAQVNPREINLFYVVKGLRERIINNGEVFEVLNTDIVFNPAQIKAEIDSYPERFSPNVILRPVYQECILPNVMYIGGGAEVAYWLELKSTFNEFGISFPLVQIRSSFLTLSTKTLSRVAQLNWKITDLFGAKSTLFEAYTSANNPLEKEVNKLNNAIRLQTEDLESSLTNYDPELVKSLNVAKKGFEKSIVRLSKKISGSVKRAHQDQLHEMEQVFSSAYPNGIYQERHVNFFEMYVKFGPKYLEAIFEETEPFCRDFSVLEM